MDREQTRNYIIEKSFRMFLEKGCKAVRMDDIARELSVSKRTLYEMFGNKDALFAQCVSVFMERHEQTVREKLSVCSDVLSMAYELLNTSIQMLQRVNPLFFKDVSEMNNFCPISDLVLKSFSDKLKLILERGKEQGVFRTDVDTDLVMYYSIRSREVLEMEYVKSHWTMDEFVNSVIMVLIRGLCTQRGLKLLEEKEMQRKNNNNNE